MCSVFGTVGRVVASDARRPGFESSHQQFCVEYLFTVKSRKDENKEEDGSSPFLRTWYVVSSTNFSHIGKY